MRKHSKLSPQMRLKLLREAKKFVGPETKKDFTDAELASIRDSFTARGTRDPYDIGKRVVTVPGQF